MDISWQTLNNTVKNDSWVKEEIKTEIEKCMDFNENENTI